MCGDNYLHIFGGFRVSFITDNFQGVCVLLLLIICAAGMGSYIEIDTSKIGPSGLLKANKLGWQLVYILFVAIVTNDCFMSGFWLRTFASKTDKDLWIGTHCCVRYFCHLHIDWYYWVSCCLVWRFDSRR